MAIYVNSNADKKTATAAMIDIEIRFPQMVDEIENALAQRTMRRKAVFN